MEHHPWWPGALPLQPRPGSGSQRSEHFEWFQQIYKGLMQKLKWQAIVEVIAHIVNIKSMIEQVSPEEFGALSESFCCYKDSYIQLAMTMWICSCDKNSSCPLLYRWMSVWQEPSDSQQFWWEEVEPEVDFGDLVSHNHELKQVDHQGTQLTETGEHESVGPLWATLKPFVLFNISPRRATHSFILQTSKAIRVLSFT